MIKVTPKNIDEVIKQIVSAGRKFRKKIKNHSQHKKVECGFWYVHGCYECGKWWYENQKG